MNKEELEKVEHIMSEQSERTDSPVYFGGYDTLREKSASKSYKFKSI